MGPLRWVYWRRFPIIPGGSYGLDQPIFEVDALRGKSGVDSLRTPKRRPAVGTTLDPSPEKDARGGKPGLGTDRRLVSFWQFSKRPNRTAQRPPSCRGALLSVIVIPIQIGNDWPKRSFPDCLTRR